MVERGSESERSTLAAVHAVVLAVGDRAQWYLSMFDSDTD